MCLRCYFSLFYSCRQPEFLKHAHTFSTGGPVRTAGSPVQHHNSLCLLPRCSGACRCVLKQRQREKTAMILEKKLWIRINLGRVAGHFQIVWTPTVRNINHKTFQTVTYSQRVDIPEKNDFENRLCNDNRPNVSIRDSTGLS